MSLEQPQPRRNLEIIKDGLNNLFVKVRENGVELRAYGSALKQTTYSIELTSEEALSLKGDLELLLGKKKPEVVVTGIEGSFSQDGYSLKFTKAFGKNFNIIIENSQFEEEFKMKITTSDLLELLG